MKFSTDTIHLANQLRIELSNNGYVEITDLPSSSDLGRLGCDLWLFQNPSTYEFLIPSNVEYGGANELLQRAMESELQAGNFKSVITFERDTAQMEELADFVISELVSTPGPPESDQADRPRDVGFPDQLTDFDTLLATPTTQRIPTVAELTANLELSVKGQSDALMTVAEGMVSHLFKPSPERPLRLLFVGPSGVGKTATAKAMKEVLAEDGLDFRIVKVDCNQLQSDASITSLLGASPGYVGYNEGTALINTLASGQRTIVIFDEIEKAHPSISQVLMGLMDEGRLTLNRPVNDRWELDCRNSVLIFTSNQAADTIVRDTRNMDRHAAGEYARQVLIGAGMPHYIAGRHGDIAVFQHITREAAAAILTLEVANHVKEFGLELIWIQPETLAPILDQSEFQTTGARELRLLAERACRPAVVAYLENLVQEGAAIETLPEDDPRLQVVISGIEPAVTSAQVWFSRSDMKVPEE